MDTVNKLSHKTDQKLTAVFPKHHWALVEICTCHASQYIKKNKRLPVSTTCFQLTASEDYATAVFTRHG